VIAMLQGEVAVRRPDHVVVLAGSVATGAVSAETLAHIPASVSRWRCTRNLIVRDDALGALWL